MSFENEYRELMEKPIEEIREDIFFRPDNFQHELWYGDFQMYMTVGICQPPEEHALQVRKALKVVGGADRSKAIIILNPAEPPLMMSNTIYSIVN